MLVLGGDIGGTKTRLILVEFKDNQRQVIAQDKFFNAEHKGLSEIIERFLQTTDVSTGQIQSACIAVAGPIHNGTVEFTNLPWFIEEHTLEQELGLSKVTLINDFAAIGYGIESLSQDDIITLHKGEPCDKAPKSLIGAGTGLGVGLLVHNGSQYTVLPTEGGHTDFAPTNDDQMDLLNYLRKKWHRVSFERVVSGPGLVNIYKYVRDNPIYNEQENPDLKRELHRTDDQAAMISRYATECGDSMALRAIDIFIHAYATKAGNIALSTLCHGGIYLVGGIAPKLAKQLQDGRFMRTFTDKGRMSGLVNEIPVYIVLNTHIGLEGAANYASQHLK